MKYEEFENAIDELKDSFGDEGAKHADEFIALKSAFKEKTEYISSQDEEIKKLQEDNSDLLKTNGKLFQQVGREIKGDPEPSTLSDSTNAEEERIELDDIFDSRGRFIK